MALEQLDILRQKMILNPSLTPCKILTQDTCELKCEGKNFKLLGEEKKTGKHPQALGLSKEISDLIPKMSIKGKIGT